MKLLNSKAEVVIQRLPTQPHINFNKRNTE